MINPSYICISDLILERQDYVLALSKHYVLSKGFRFFGWISALDVARKRKEMLETGGHQSLDDINLRKEAATMMFRTSQRHWEVPNLVETEVNGVGCLKMRLEHRMAISIFGTLNIPSINPRILSQQN